jgi:transcriptional regulator with PAS, ATPase and Fis domain
MDEPLRTLHYWVSLAEQLAIHLALEEHKGDRRKAAASLGIGLRTLYSKLSRYRMAAWPPAGDIGTH